MGSVIRPALLLAAITWFSFGNALDAGWTDTDALADLSFARAPIADQLLAPLTGGLGGDNANFWRPAAMIQYWLLFRLFGENPVAWHAWDLGLHWVASILASGLAMAATGSRRLGWIAGALFCAHPLAVEIVPAIPRNLDMLLAIGFFGALLAVGTAWFWPCVVLAFGSKEAAIVLLPVLAAWAPWKTPWLRLALFVVGWGVVRWVVLGGVGGYGTDSNIVDALIRGPVELYASAASPFLNPLPPNPVPALLVAGLLWWGRRPGRAATLGLALVLGFLLLYGISGTYTRRLLYVPTLGAILLAAGRPLLLALACVPWLAGSPLLRPDRDWALTGRVAAAYMDVARYAALPAGTTLWLVDRPERVESDPRRLRLWGKEVSLNHAMASYSLAGWLSDRLPQRFGVRNLTSFTARGLPASAGVTRDGDAWMVHRAVERSIADTDQFVLVEGPALRIEPTPLLSEPAALVIYNPDSVTVVPVRAPVTTSSAPGGPPAAR